MPNRHGKVDAAKIVYQLRLAKSLLMTVFYALPKIESYFNLILITLKMKTLPLVFGRMSSKQSIRENI